jgi:hypothetical protein
MSFGRFFELIASVIHIFHQNGHFIVILSMAYSLVDDRLRYANAMERNT